MGGLELAETIIVEEDRENQFPLLNTVQLRALYGMVIRKYAQGENFHTFDVDETAYGLGRRMRQEITRRIGDDWLARYYESRRVDA